MSACARIADSTVEEDDGALSLFVTIPRSKGDDVKVGKAFLLIYESYS